MEQTTENLLDREMEFPSIPRDEIPEPAIAIRGILEGELSMRGLYLGLEDRLREEAHCLIRILRLDWERTFTRLVGAAGILLKDMGADPSPAPRPGKDQLARLISALEKMSPADILEGVEAFASRALFSHRLVPWVNDYKEVFEHFRRCLEAEDHHFALLHLFRGILSPLESVDAMEPEALI
jgi:hypothetical protein